MSSLSPVKATGSNETSQNPSLFQTPPVTRFDYRAYVADNIKNKDRFFNSALTPSPFYKQSSTSFTRTDEEINALTPESFAPTKEQVKKLWEAKALRLLVQPKKENLKTMPQDKTFEIAMQFSGMSLSSSSTTANASKNAKS
jgi:hypothetical protein